MPLDFETPSYFLALGADSLNDVEGARKATVSRIDALKRDKGLCPGDPSVDELRVIVEQIAAIEKGAQKALKRTYRLHPLHKFTQAMPGLGEQQSARLLGAIGDPAHRADGTPRTEGQFMAYCGYHTIEVEGGRIAAKRMKGHKANWSHEAKMRAHLMAESCLKKWCPAHAAVSAEWKATHGKDTPKPWAPPPEGCECPEKFPYRATYDAARLAWADRDATDKHKHNHALRMVAKRILRDLYREAVRLHIEAGTWHGAATFCADGQGRVEPHTPGTVGAPSGIGGQSAGDPQGRGTPDATFCADGHTSTEPQSRNTVGASTTQETQP